MPAAIALVSVCGAAGRSSAQTRAAVGRGDRLSANAYDAAAGAAITGSVAIRARRALAGSVVFEESSVKLGVAEGRTDIWGLAVYDWDGDGCDDLYVGRHRRAEPHLYRNGCPGAFTDEIARLRIPNPGRTNDKHSVAFGDYDGDGRPDLFISTGGGRGQGPGDDDQLYHQLADGSFEDVAPVEGITNREGSGRFGLWFDYDLDGDLDLFLGHQFRSVRPDANSNFLWQNTDGHFANVAPSAGIGTQESSNSGVATDLDGDGDLDMITAPGLKTSVYENLGDGTFAQTSLGLSGVVSAAPGDYDNDGDLDLFLSRRDNLDAVLLENRDGVWHDVSAQAGVRYPYGGAAIWLDVDNDGRLDLFLARQASADGRKQPNVLLLNRGDGTFADIASEAGVTGPTGPRLEQMPPPDRTSAAWGDFDRDGRVDLAVVTPFSHEDVQVYLNQTANGNSWITLRLRDPESANHDGIGAKTWVTAGGSTQYREVMATTARMSQSPPYLMIGVGASRVIDTLKVGWPDGTFSVFSDLAVDHDYVVTKGSSHLIGVKSIAREAPSSATAQLRTASTRQG